MKDMETKTISGVRRELKKLRKKLITEGVNENEALNLARKAMNEKYGHDWRSVPYLAKESCGRSFPTGYEGHIHGQHWMD